MHSGVRRFIRNAAPVDALHLGTPDDLDVAAVWLRRAGVARVLRDGDELTVGEGRTRMTVRLGQVLVHDPAVGAFTVEDDQHFRACHQAAS